MNNLKRYTLYIMNLTDVVSFIISYLVTYYIRFFTLNQTAFVIEIADYRKFLLAIIISYVACNQLLFYREELFTRRSVREEMKASFKAVFFAVAFTLGILYATKTSDHISRVFVLMYSIISLCFLFLARIFVKKTILPKYQLGEFSENILIITEKKKASDLIDSIQQSKDWRFMIRGLVVVDEDMVGQSISGIKIIANRSTMIKAETVQEIDSVFLAVDEESSELKRWAYGFQNLNKNVHINIEEFRLRGMYPDIDSIGAAPVITYRFNMPMPKRQAILRRFLSFMLALVCLPFYLLVYGIVFLFSLFDTSHHILIKRVRMGINGRRFYQYRFRVFRMDAMERIDHDQSPYTFIGAFLRKTHLDGLPLILNVLIGDMNFIGPKALNIRRYLLLTRIERSYFSIRPGIFGYWSCDEDMQVIMQAQREFLANWTIWKEMIILANTFVRYISGNSLRRDGETHINEELNFISEVQALQKPLSFEKNYEPTYSFGYDLYLVIKRFLDMIGALLGIIILSPLLFILCVAVIVDDGGNPIYGHERIGKNGKKICIYKFRSMRIDAGNLEELLTPAQLEQYRTEFKVDNDPRITKVGNFIRKTSLDELPQLFNILFGDLSIVGPRPIVEAETKIYGKEIAKLLSVKPGLTGYWQAYARNNATYETGERQKMEMYYVINQNLWLDIKIVFRTITSVLKREGAK